MKKILLCSLIAIIFSNCEMSIKKSNAHSQYQTDDGIGIFHNYSYQEIEREGMKYGILYGDYSYYTTETGGAVAVINLTKDSLEVELLKKQLKKWK